MFCTKCGKQLHDGDIFCAHCGNKVREDIARENMTGASRYEEVVFNPPFKVEAERRTKQLSGEERPYTSEPKRERIHFDWNLDGFPGREMKKDEDFELNWEAVIEKRREHKPIDVERIIPPESSGSPSAADNVYAASENAKAGENGDKSVLKYQTSDYGEAADRHEAREEKTDSKDVLSIEDLERELFGAADFEEANAAEKGVTIEYSRSELPKGKEHFYTYNAKRDAFQALLDNERMRIEEMENRRKSQWEEIAPESAAKQTIKEPPKFEEVFVEPELPLVPPVKEVAVALPPLTAAVTAYETGKAASSEGIEANVKAEVNLKPEAGAKTEANVRPEANVKAEANLEPEANLKPEETLKAKENTVAKAGEAEPKADGEPKAEQKKASEPEEAKTATAAAAKNPENKHESGNQTAAEKSKNAAASESGGKTSERGESKDTPPFQSEEKQQKTKLRYSDIFPANAFDGGDSSSGDGAGPSASKEEIVPELCDDDDEEEYKGNKVIKTLIIILAVIVAVELVIIGVKAIAPDSGFSKTVDNLMEKVTGLFTGEDENNDGKDGGAEESTYMYEYIAQFSETAENIGSVSYLPDLKYDLSKSYAFEQISDTGEFADESSAYGDSGKTYGEAITEAVIGYYNGWQNRNQDENLVGINSLEIGEIRSGANEYYVLNKITYAAADGSTVTEYQSVRLASAEGGIIVDEVKEETI